MVVSFSRQYLGQTGDGHFSPVAAYHEPTDQCLVLDVARFKYAPYWVPVKDLYESTRPIDSMTNKSRGWFLLYPPPATTNANNGSMTKFPLSSNDGAGYRGAKATDERMRPADLVPSVGDGPICPVGDIKVTYCSVRVKKLDKDSSAPNK